MHLTERDEKEGIRQIAVLLGMLTLSLSDNLAIIGKKRQSQYIGLNRVSIAII